ncbi:MULTISPECIES: FKBP-type peptidyl-prolyl cis-trans isomerase [Fluviicola]|uniref:FKBP-type peptidyl-prolyl cis-trans isomerase n=1 Tax=Fluviicola TaxID=332102 RepID=UPI003137F6B6
MTVDTNTVVSLHYKLTNHKTGEQIEETSKDQPMEFLYGVERIIPAFEVNIHGLKAGDTFEFSIPSLEAYGDKNDDHLAMIPLSVFFDETGKIDDTQIKVGAILPMTDNEGNHLRGTILEIKDDTVTMDFNHPLAGTDLFFQGTILAVREATQDEITHGHSHGEHGHHH